MVNGTFALLLGGNETAKGYEHRFTEAILDWRDYLLCEAGFNPARVWVYCEPLGNAEVLQKTEDFFAGVNAEDPQEDVVLIYSGHGLKGRLCPRSENFPISYEELAKLIDHDGRTLFINDTCYSGSAIPVFEKQGILPGLGSVIASSAVDEKSYGAVFGDNLLESFRQSKPYRKRKIEWEIEKRVGYNPNGEKKFRPWTVIKKIKEKRAQHPKRKGISLDHLLFKQ